LLIGNDVGQNLWNSIFGA